MFGVPDEPVKSSRWLPLIKVAIVVVILIAVSFVIVTLLN
jgi:hypothetical protein